MAEDSVVAVASAPSDGNRKRSRSPSDLDQPKLKRANTGLANNTTTSAGSNGASASASASAASRSQSAHDSSRLDDSSAHSAPTAATASINDRDVHMRDFSSDADAPSNDTAASTPTTAEAAKADTSSSTADTQVNSSNMSGTTAAAAAVLSSNGPPPPPTPTSATIHMRCLIVTQDASIIIGRGGKHVNEIREKSGARVMVSESIPGNPERILNVSGPLDAVSKAFGLIVRRINDEPFDVPSVPGSRAVTIKFMIPNSRMGSIIGKQGSKIKEIQDASGARLNASEGMLPGSTERVLSVAGVADAIHIATYYVGNILIEAQERNPSSNNSSYRPSSNRAPRPPMSAGSQSYVPPYASTPYVPMPPHSQMPPHMMANPAQQLQTQQIYIPNDLVGCIIGKGGSKINEIRHMSASQIKIMEPGATPPGMNGPVGSENERLVIITGQAHNVQMAVQLLYHRLEQEKQKQQQLQTQRL
ncbi:PBP2 [Sanghuangporus weigelae]